MLDRESTFAEPQIVQMLKEQFIPVAIDQAYQRRQQDSEGEFYRKIAGQGPRSNFNGTTQGFYIATAAGELLLYNNNRDPAKVRDLMRRKLAEFAASPAANRSVAPVVSGKLDPRWNVRPPAGGLVVRVRAKVLDGYEPTEDPWRRIFQESISRDNLWMTQDEQIQLSRGVVPASVQQRIARFHLVDNTRGEPAMWSPDEVKHVAMSVQDGKLRGKAHLETKDGKRGFVADLLGVVETREGTVTRFDVVALGDCWGEGPFTRGAPPGKFPLAVTLTLADGSDTADAIPPQGSRGWLPGYLEAPARP